MKKHWKYLSYVVRHKWFVFEACRKLRVPLWQALIHDWSKFLPSEWFPYVNFFNGNYPKWASISSGQKFDGYPYTLTSDYWSERFDRAWLHHQHLNPHHWQHWVLREDSGASKLLEMPDKFICEMVADWIGAGRAITGKYEAFSWYQSNKEKIQLHPDTRTKVEQLLAEWDESRQRQIRVLGYYP